jgi:hypothetical protein
MAHGINTTVVELDPVVYQFAAKYFTLPPQLHVVIEDAIAFVEKSQAEGGNQSTYDYIVHDVFTGGAEPIALFTQEFLRGLSDMLTADGVIAIVSTSNIPSLLDQYPYHFRTTPGTFFARQPAMLCRPFGPFFQHVASTGRVLIPWILPPMRVRNRPWTSPTWSSFAGSRVTVSRSESPSKLTSLAPTHEETTYGRGMKLM